MKKTFKTMLALICLAALCSISAGDAATNSVAKPSLTVIDLEIGAGAPESLSIPLTLIVIDEIEKSGAFMLMSRERRDALLKEKGFDLPGCKGADCPIQAGKKLEVDYIVTGRVDKVGETYLLFLRRIKMNAQDVEISVKEIAAGGENGLVEAACAAAKKIAVMPENKIAQPTPQITEKDEEPLKKNCPDGMAYISDGKFCIDRFEYPNKEGAQPQNYVKFAEALDLCRKQGKRLPTQTEFESACVGGKKYEFGYSDKFQKDACNVGGYKKKGTSPSGEYKDCTNDYGVFDMIGNVQEWTDDGHGLMPMLRGGSYFTSLASRVTCGERNRPQEEQDFSWGGGYDFGFRCAKNAE